MPGEGTGEKFALDPAIVRVHQLIQNESFLHGRFKELLHASLLRALAPEYSGDSAGLVAAVPRELARFHTEKGESMIEIGAQIARRDMEESVPADPAEFKNISPDAWVDARLQTVIDGMVRNHFNVTD